jgi:hypothetical protein
MCSKPPLTGTGHAGRLFRIIFAPDLTSKKLLVNLRLALSKPPKMKIEDPEAKLAQLVGKVVVGEIELTSMRELLTATTELES